MAVMTAQEAAEWGKTLDFPTVWAALMENRESLKETARQIKEFRDDLEKTALIVKENAERQRETDRIVKENAERQKENAERQKELIEQQAERQRETARIVRENSKQLGGLHNSMGDLVETLFAPHLGEKFDAYHYNLKRIFRRVPIYDDNSRLRSDIDILLSDTTVCMAVEVKRWLERTDQVDDQIRRMQLIRQYPPAEVKGKRLLGAIVGAVVEAEVREYAEQNGFFVLELTGDDVSLLEPAEGFQPKEW